MLVGAADCCCCWSRKRSALARNHTLALHFTTARVTAASIGIVSDSTTTTTATVVVAAGGTRHSGTLVATTVATTTVAVVVTRVSVVGTATTRSKNFTCTFDNDITLRTWRRTNFTVATLVVLFLYPCVCSCVSVMCNTRRK